MTLPRSQLVSNETAHWYHIVTRCVRRAYLCGDGYEHRKDMIRNRLVLLSKLFCVEIASYAIMDNHLHIVLLLDPKGAEQLSDEDVARRWLQAFPRGWDWDDINACPEIDEERFNQALHSPETIAKWRARLGDLGWCLKALKEPIARRCNKEDNCTGAFWEGRYKSIPLLDQAALIACMAYVDLNPIRACMADKPETSDYTGIQDRIDLRQIFEKEHGLRQRIAQGNTQRHSEITRTLAQLNTDDDHNSVPHHTEDQLWLTPFKQCITGDWGTRDNGLKPEHYFTIVEETGRIIRGDKRGSINKRLAPILKRLNLDVERWIACMQSQHQMIGAAIGGTAARLQEAGRRGIQWIRNRCPLFTDTA